MKRYKKEKLKTWKWNVKRNIKKKLTKAIFKNILKENFGLSDKEIQNNVIFIGDSPNDSSMFGFFKNSIGVANVVDLIDNIDNPPKYITSNFSGDGFIEFADFVINNK